MSGTAMAEAEWRSSTAATPLAACLACGGGRLETVLDLGAQPLANAYPDAPIEQPRYPLRLNACLDCFHAQLSHSVDLRAMFETYLYRSGATPVLTPYFSWFADEVGCSDPGRSLRILEIGSNDGSLLAQFRQRGHDVTGVDPARNLAPLAREQGVKSLTAYWSDAFAATLKETYDVVIAMNVLAHGPTPLDFLRGCRRVLKPDGRLLIQTSQAHMFLNGEFDTVYHEHHSFFQTRSLMALARRAGLSVVGARHTPVHGVSNLWRLSRNGAAAEPSVDETLGWEREAGLHDMAALRAFGVKAGERVRQVSECVVSARKDGLTVVAYGAAAKGVVFLNAARLALDFIVDDSSLKQGRFLPGRKTPILSLAQAARHEGACLWVVTAWNFRDEIMARLREVRPGRHDRYLTYFPQLRVES